MKGTAVSAEVEGINKLDKILDP